MRLLLLVRLVSLLIFLCGLLAALILPLLNQVIELRDIHTTNHDFVQAIEHGLEHLAAAVDERWRVEVCCGVDHTKLENFFLEVSAEWSKFWLVRIEVHG